MGGAFAEGREDWRGRSLPPPWVPGKPAAVRSPQPREHLPPTPAGWDNPGSQPLGQGGGWRMLYPPPTVTRLSSS